VVVVGGLAIGGAGRTPLVAWLAQGLAARGLQVAVVAHDYGARLRQPECVEVAGRRWGDEAVALRRILPTTIAVWSGPRQATVAAAQGDVVLVDGGYFDDDLVCRARIAVVDATAPRRVWPAGPLRAPLAALGRADVIWLHRVDEPGASPLPAPWGAQIQSRVALRRIHLPDGTVVGPEWLVGRGVRPLTGIARPGSFHHLLTQAGAHLLPGLECADHHVFTPRELAGCLAQGAGWVTTTKDHPRLPLGWPVAVVETETEVVEGDPQAVLDRCAPGA
jgi:tetraacyldisaccharide 4'-kinase